MADAQTQLLTSLGVSVEMKRSMVLEGWDCYSLNHNSNSRDVPILLIESGPKNINDIKRAAKQHDTCVIISSELKKMLIKTLDKTYTVSLDSEIEYFRIADILKANNAGSARNEIELNAYLDNVIEAIPNMAGDFENRGLFSTHYMRHRVFDDVPSDFDIQTLRAAGNNVNLLLDILGWKMNEVSDVVRVVITEQENFSIRETEDNVAPSYTAVSELSSHRWVILTNGTKWRLYTNRISASSTNYFEINLHNPSDLVLRYLSLIFGHASFDGDSPRIDFFFDQGKEFATQLEEDLTSRIISQDGVLLNLAKGILGHDMKTVFDGAELAAAKETALRVMYRVWFVAYAESRNLLPVSNEKYGKMSLRYLRSQLDKHESDSEEDSCWKYLLNLFDGIRNGSPEHNLPQYNGELFSHNARIDGVTVHNRWIVPAIRDMLERDGDAIDYASLSVRHLGNILEGIMEFSIQQAIEDIMLLEKNGKLIQIKTKKESTYSYKKNDLYLASKGGIVIRKNTASFYTPDKIVSFLVMRGLEPILNERSKQIRKDLKEYEKNPKDNYRTCMDRLLDIQVLDPTMGSGHFLVESLNHLTSWATDILRKHPQHPLLGELKNDRNAILAEQESKGITIDDNLLTDEVLLKRRIMKRCIFGVDLNPMAVEITKLALWLDSFAIGVPLTYLDHHIKHGNSIIGSQLKELKSPKNGILDDYLGDPNDSSDLFEDIGSVSDITVKQVKDSKAKHTKYKKQTMPYKIMLDILTAIKMDDTIISKSEQKNIFGYLRIVSDVVSGKNNSEQTIRTINKIEELSDKYSFFNWEVEMVDAFTDTRHGFDLIVGNPPWDKIRPNKNEFFTGMDYRYKHASDTLRNKIMKQYGSEYDEYVQRFDEQRRFYKNRKGISENTDYDAYRLVVEQAIRLLADGGIFSMLIPSAITSSRGATGLRKYFLNKDILSLYVFENSKKIFPIHASQRFALLTVRNSDVNDVNYSSKEFPVGFYLHEMKSLLENATEMDKFSTLKKKAIQSISPDLFMIYETQNAKSHKIVHDMFTIHPRLEVMEGWSVDLGRELNMGEEKDRKLLVKNGGWPVLDSKTFHQHLSKFASPRYHADIKKTLKRTASIGKFNGKSNEIHENPRLVYRNVSGSGNTRTMVACMIPHSTFTTIGTYMAIPRKGLFAIDDDYHALNAYLCGIFNSTAFDHLIRPIIDKNVETYHIYNTPVPKDFTSRTGTMISKFSALLALSESWHDDMALVFNVSKKDVKDFTLNDRIDITAKIDALVALHYQLTYPGYEHLLKTFKTSDEQFTDEELSSQVNHVKMPDGERNKHMRKFYHQVYKRALEYYSKFTKNTVILEGSKD